MKTKVIFSILSMVVLSGVLQAAPVFIDFDDAARNEVINTRYAAMGATFGGIGGGNVIAYSHSQVPASPVSDPRMAVNLTGGIRMLFTDSINSISVIGCDYGGSLSSDLEIATLTAYNSAGTILGTYTDQAVRDSRTVNGVTFPVDTVLLELAGIGPISRVDFRFTNTAGFFGIDNLTFDSAPVVPVPGSLLLGGLGTFLVSAYRRKRS